MLDKRDIMARLASLSPDKVESLVQRALDEAGVEYCYGKDGIIFNGTVFDETYYYGRTVEFKYKENGECMAADRISFGSQMPNSYCWNIGEESPDAA